MESNYLRIFLIFTNAKKRLIFTLLYQDGFFVQSRNFRLQKVGNISWLMNNYNFATISTSIDELVMLDVSRGSKRMPEFIEAAKEICQDLFIPLALGGGISSFEDAATMFKNGADKLVINSAIYENPNLIKDLISIYGSQAIVASIDYRYQADEPRACIRNATVDVDLPFVEYLRTLVKLNIGEVYLNSIDKDGTGHGYDLNILDYSQHLSPLPIILSGGAGNKHHLLEGFTHQSVEAVSTSNLFNFIGNGLPNSRDYLLDASVDLARWK